MRVIAPIGGNNSSSNLLLHFAHRIPMTVGSELTCDVVSGPNQEVWSRNASTSIYGNPPLFFNGWAAPFDARIVRLLHQHFPSSASIFFDWELYIHTFRGALNTRTTQLLGAFSTYTQQWTEHEAALDLELSKGEIVTLSYKRTSTAGDSTLTLAANGFFEMEPI